MFFSIKSQLSRISINNLNRRILYYTLKEENARPYKDRHIFLPFRI